MLCLEMAVKACDNLGKGKLFDANDVESVTTMLAIYSTRRSDSSSSSLWIPYTDQAKEGEWSNYYDGKVATLPWTPSQPNGGTTQNCASTSITPGKVIDNVCTAYDRKAVCEFTDTPSFKLKGLSLDSGIDTMYYVQNTENFIEYIGYMDTVIRFNSTSKHWTIIQRENEIAEASDADQASGLLLGMKCN